MLLVTLVPFNDLQSVFSNLLLLVRELHSRRLQRKKVNLSFPSRELFLTCSFKQITWAFKQLTSFFYKLPLCLALDGSFHVLLCVSMPIPIFLSSFLHIRIKIFTCLPVKSSHILHPFENEGLQFIKAVKTAIMLYSKCNSISTTWAVVRNAGYQTLLQTYCNRICSFIKCQGDLFAHWCLRSAILDPCVGLVSAYLCSVKTLPPIWVSASSCVRWMI